MTTPKKPDHSDHPDSTILVSLRDYALVGVFLVVWLIPIMYVGLFKKSVPFAGNYLNNLYRCACLFTSKMKTWSNYYFQIQLEDGNKWINAKEENYSRLKPFGYRTRLKRIIGKSNSPSTQKTRRAIAEFIKKRYEADHPDERKVIAVRFIRVAYETGTEEMAKPSGKWERPPLDEIPVRRQQVLSVHSF